MSTGGILLIGIGLAGLAALFTGNLDRAIERLGGAVPAAAAAGGAAGTSRPLGGSGAVLAARAASGAGFRGESLATAVAIAGGESGWRADAVGDVALANAEWGPSIGLWQIRSRREQAGTGRERDATRLTDPAHNAAAAWSISAGGTNWRPWTVYNTGAYRAHLDAARAAIAAAGVG